MRKPLLLAVMLILCLTSVSSGSAQADLLEGKVILFAVDNNEAAPFDNEVTGVSRLTGLLIRQGTTVGMVNWSLELPPVDLIILVGPARDYSGGQVARLWRYMHNGGNLLVLADPPLLSGRSLSEDGGLFELLWHDFGVRMTDEVLIDPPGGVLPSEAATEDETPPDKPVVVLEGMVSLDDAHPLMLNVDPTRMLLDTARPVAVTGNALAVLATTELIYAEGNVREFDRDNEYFYNQASDGNQQNYPVGAATEQGDSRVVLVGDADIATNGGGFLTSPPGSDAFVWPDNVRFIMNSIYWLLKVDIPDVLVFPEPLPTGTPTMTPSPTPEVTPTPTERTR